jgi:cell division protein FtsI/penicillin-binding protein 2
MGSVPIGYTTAVTPMQMLDVFTTIGNGGVTRPPRLVAATIDANGVRHNRPPQRGRRVVSAQTAAEMNEMLRGVVRKGGTGELANIDGYTVAGKTGTSRKPPYETERYMASFAGFAPERPEPRHERVDSGGAGEDQPVERVQRAARSPLRRSSRS